MKDKKITYEKSNQGLQSRQARSVQDNRTNGVNKKKMSTKIKTYFMIINLIVAIIAFSYMIRADVVISPSASPFASTTSQISPSILTVGSKSSAGVSSKIITPGSTATASSTAAQSTAAKISQSYTSNLFTNLLAATGIGVLGALAGSLTEGQGAAVWGFISGFVGATVYQMALASGLTGLQAGLLGGGIGLAIFLFTYKEIEKEKVEFNCLPWQAPIGGGDCEKCNDYEECSIYTCRSLGQACDLVNKGTKDEMCIWKNPRDVNSPIIKMIEVLEGLEIIPQNNLRPMANGVEIQPVGRKCIKAFTPLKFTFVTKDSETGLGEPAQCKIDYNLTVSSKDNVRAAYEDMNYFVGGSSMFSYNHTEVLSLPGPDALNSIAPELQNDGEYTLYIRCQDANGNFNQDPYAVKFCVEPGPDTTPPRIEDVSIPSGNPIQFNQTELGIEVYVNEPAECKWSREDRTYDNMEHNMRCDLNVWDMNNNNVYTCRTTLTGIESRKENNYYFRCKDQPFKGEADRNVNTQSYPYKIVGTQPLNILKVSPDGTIYGATDVIPVYLQVKTDNGYKNGDAICYYSLTKNEGDYIEFLETGSNEHKQRQDLVTGDYTYYFKCVDLGGNAVYNSTSFRVETDKSSPVVVRAYKESGELKVITNERAECSYSNLDCNFEIDDGIKMSSADFESHTTEWKVNQNYYIRCKDKYNNQPNSNRCSITVRPSQLKGG